jgi:hypothetical protein
MKGFIENSEVKQQGSKWVFCKEVKIKKSNASDEESGGVDGWQYRAVWHG